MFSTLQIFLMTAFAFYFVTSLALGYLASYMLLKVVAYLSPWLPIWMWFGDVGLFIHAVAIAATCAVGVIAVAARKSYAQKLCSYILAAFLLVEIVMTMQLMAKKSSLGHVLHQDLEHSMQISQSNYSIDAVSTQLWDEIQLEVNCCGVDSYKDWYSTKFGNGVNVPDSCCLLVTPGCGENMAGKPDPESEIIIDGCLPTIMKSIRNDYNYFGYGLLLPCLGVQFILVIIIMYLVRKINTNEVSTLYVIPSTWLQSDSPKYQPLKFSYT